MLNALQRIVQVPVHYRNVHNVSEFIFSRNLCFELYTHLSEMLFQWNAINQHHLTNQVTVINLSNYKISSRNLYEKGPVIIKQLNIQKIRNGNMQFESQIIPQWNTTTSPSWIPEPLNKLCNQTIIVFDTWAKPPASVAGAKLWTVIWHLGDRTPKDLKRHIIFPQRDSVPHYCQGSVARASQVCNEVHYSKWRMIHPCET